MKKYFFFFFFFFLSENFQFLEVKFSIYLKKRVFVMEILYKFDKCGISYLP